MSKLIKITSVLLLGILSWAVVYYTESIVLSKLFFWLIFAGWIVAGVSVFDRFVETPEVTTDPIEKYESERSKKITMNVLVICTLVTIAALVAITAVTQIPRLMLLLLVAGKGVCIFAGMLLIVACLSKMLEAIEKKVWKESSL